MQTDPMEEWRRLTTLYGEMGDVEIRELADQINDLMPTAQQVLRNEIKKRGMAANEADSRGDDPDGRPRGFAARTPAAVHAESRNYRYAFSDLPDDDERQREYSWKVPLCDCPTSDEAWCRGEMLRRVGVESWIVESPPRVLVAADQLDQARAAVLHPIPQDIIDEYENRKAAWRDYENPVCPKCRAEDPTLESTEPSNNWLCESCGYTWSDPLVDDAQDA
jgi:hypothetical protein